MSAVEAAHSLLNVPGKPDALHRVKNEPGYHTPTFAAKDEQRAKVQALIASKGFIPQELVANEVGRRVFTMSTTSLLSALAGRMVLPTPRY